RTRTEPRVGRYSPYAMFISVLLPAPFSPTTATTSPFATASEISSQATVSPKILVSPTSSSRGALGPVETGPIGAGPWEEGAPALTSLDRGRPEALELLERGGHLDLAVDHGLPELLHLGERRLLVGEVHGHGREPDAALLEPERGVPRLELVLR